MRSFAGRSDLRAAFAVGRNGNAISIRQVGSVGLHHGLGDAGHRVRGRAARELQHDAVGDGLADQLAVVATLLAVAHGELGIGREQERRIVVMLVVVGHVGHAGFFVRAEQEADGVGELRSLAGVLQVLPELHGVQRHHAGALVVERAATDEVAFLARDRVRLEVPAGTGGNHVHVADDAQLRVALAGEVGEPDVALGIVRLESHVGSHFKRGLQRLLRAGAERSAFGRLVRFLEAGDADERLDVFDHRLPIFLEIRVDLPGQFSMFHGKFASLFECVGFESGRNAAFARRYFHYDACGCGALGRHPSVDRNAKRPHARMHGVAWTKTLHRPVR